MKADQKEETTPAPAPVEKRELTERPKEVVSGRVQPVLPKLILPKPASVVATSQGSTVTGTVSRSGVTVGDMSPSVLLLTPPANTHPQPMLYLSPQQNAVQQPIVLTPATMGQHWPANSAPLTFGSVIVSSIPQQTSCTAGAVTSTAGAAARQCLQQPPRHQQLQQLLQQPAQLLPRQQVPMTTRALPRSEVKPAGRALAELKPSTHSTAPISSVCHRPMGDSAVVTVRAPVSLPSNQSTNLASNPCLAALIRASPTRSSINGPLTFQGGLHLHADLAPGGAHLHTDLAPCGSSVSGAYMESRGMQNVPQHNPLRNNDRLVEETTANVCMTNTIASGACPVQSHMSSPQHNMTQAEVGVGSPASGRTPQKTAAKSASSGKVLKTPAKTVSTLLKEQRGYGPQEDQRAPYVKDKRPVSELLKESRIKRQLNNMQPRVVMLDTAQNGDGNLTPVTTEPSGPFGNNDNSIVVVNMPGLTTRPDAAANPKSNVLASDSSRQSSWSGSSGSTNRMIQLLLSKADESQGSGSWSSDGSVDMPVAERDSLLGCFSMDMPLDLADITPSISTVESCELQSLSSTVATAPAGQMVGSRLQQLRMQNRQMEQETQLNQMKAMFAGQCQGAVQQQRNSAMSFSDCLMAAAATDTSTRRPQSESSIEHYRHQQDDLTGLAQPLIAVTSRPGSDVTGVYANTGYQTQMHLPQKCSLPQNHAPLNNVRGDQMTFGGSHECNPSASLMLSPQSTLSHASPATTPLSILSPKTHHRENGISGCQSFTPISGGFNFESRSFVSPVRPKATMGTVAHEHGCVSVASDPERAPLKPVITSELDGNRGFLPYAAATTSASGADLSQMFPWLSDTVGSTVPVMTCPQESPYGIPQVYNNDGHFAPVSSIRPVKRGRCGSNAGVTKRARHHSAQSSFSVERSSTPLDSGGRACVGPAQNFAIRQQQPVESAAFSPEIQHIMGSDGILTSQAQAAYNMHRSRSVPAHHVVHDGRHGDEGEFSAAPPPDRSYSRGFDEPSNEEITHLLQDKMDGMAGTARGLHAPPVHEYGARKNLTELLEGGATQQQQIYSSCRGDHMISGASWRPATLTFGDGARHRFRRATSYPGEDAALTPPSSQNPTPVDFGGVVATVDQSQSRPCSRQDCISGGRTFAVATAMHTPSSMDVTGDGREPLDEALFSDVYDDDSSATRGTADSVSPADQLVTDNQPMSLEWGLV